MQSRNPMGLHPIVERAVSNEFQEGESRADHPEMLDGRETPKGEFVIYDHYGEPKEWIRSDSPVELSEVA